MTLPSSKGLLADLAAVPADHPIDVGVLGEYAFAGRQRGPEAAAELYPRVAAHLRAGCEACHEDLAALDALARRSGSAGSNAPPVSVQAVISQPGPASEPHGEHAGERPSLPDLPPPEPIEIAEAVALARAIEAEHEALRAPLRPDRAGQVDTLRTSTRRRHLLLVEAALVRQRLAARRLLLDRMAGPQPAATPPSAGSVGARRPIARPLNPKAGLLLDDFASQVDDLGRLAGRLGRLIIDLRRLGDDPRGPARPQSEALTERGLGMTREALAVDRRLARLQGPLAGML